MTVTCDPRHPEYYNEADLRAEMTRAYDLCHGCRLCHNLCQAFPSLFPMIDDKDGAVDRLTTAEPDRVVDECYQWKATGIASERLLPPYTGTRFTTWFKKRTPGPLGRERQASVAVFPTCLVEYQNPAIGQDLVKVHERNGVDCSLVEGAGCCGAPWLHSGEMGAFAKQARKEIAVLAAAVRQGKDIVVPQPTCGYVLKRDYVVHVGGPDAELVAAHSYYASEYLWRLHRAEATSIDTDFVGQVPETTAYHVPCHLQAQNIGLRSRDLIKLTGTKITLVNKCSGIDRIWGYREDHYDESRHVAQPMAQAIQDSGAEVVVGDCHLANGAIRQETGRVAMHPLQLLARAYAIAPEAGERTSDGEGQ